MTVAPPPRCGAVEASLLLERGCGRWLQLQDDLHRVVSATAAAGSRLSRDDTTARVHAKTAPIWPYTVDRVSNAGRLLHGLGSLTGSRDDGTVEINATAMYPLLRGALEDAATIVWLLGSPQQRVRMLRAARTLHADRAFADNQRGWVELAIADDERARAGYEEEPEVAEQRKATLTAQATEVVAWLRVVDGDVLRVPQRTEILRDAFGERSRHLTTWKLLSDLSHHSFALGALMTSDAEHAEQPLVRVLLACVSSVNDALAEAIGHIDAALLGKS